MKTLISAFLLSALCACSASPTNHYYTLSATHADVATPSFKPFVIDNLTIPAYLDKPQMVMKSGATEVKLLEYNRWAEPLQSMITRILSEDLSSNYAHRPRTISVAIDQFDADDKGNVALKATWVVKNDSANAKHYIFEKTIATKSHDIDYLVLTMSHLLSDFALAITSQTK